MCDLLAIAEFLASLIKLAIREAIYEASGDLKQYGISLVKVRNNKLLNRQT